MLPDTPQKTERPPPGREAAEPKPLTDNTLHPAPAPVKGESDPGMGGWIKLWRKSVESAAWQDADLWRLWSLCLLSANHRGAWVKVDGLAAAVRVEPGQFITGRFELYRRLFPKHRRSNPDPKTVWNWLHVLQDMQNLTLKSSNKFTVVTITNWESYQSEAVGHCQQNAPHVASTLPAHCQHVSTNKNEENGKNEEKTGEDGGAPVPVSPPEPPVVTIPLCGSNGEHGVTVQDIETYKQDFPGVDVLTELRKCAAWNRAKPQRRKTPRGIQAHIVTWLSKAQDRGGAAFQPQTPLPDTDAPLVRRPTA